MAKTSYLRRTLTSLFGGRIRRYMPPIRTIEDILSHLNEQYGPGWVIAAHLNGLPIANVSGPNQLQFSDTAGMVVKVFVNTTTAEIRFYLAKLISDVPERGNL